MITRTLRCTYAIAAAIAIATAAPAAHADEATREAGKHFQRGVALYGEADYRAALVEFDRAYALAPNAAVLFNVGETKYQLQDYAGALTTFERFLAEASPSDPNRAQVESTVEVLRARVGHVTITTSPAGADVTIDDRPVGKTPLAKAVLVGIGHRKVVATMAGRAPVTRWVDVAAEDDVPVQIELPEAAAIASPNAPPARSLSATATEPASNGATLRTIGWISAGALAAGAVTFGLLAEKASNNLETARATYPTNAATLSHDAGVVSTYSILADSLAVGALVIGGVTLLSTLTGPAPPSTPSTGGAGAVRVGVGPGSARVEMTF